MEEHEKYIRSLIELHRGLERQGPGDTDYSNFIISQIPGLPTNPRIADIGCGAGAGTLFLANRFKSKVRAVDFSRVKCRNLYEFIGKMPTLPSALNQKTQMRQNSNKS